MGDKEEFSLTSDYDVPLLRLLYKLPGGQGETAEVCRLYDQEFGHLIPAKDRGIRASNNQAIWYNNVCWSRARLKERGLLDMPRRGIWRITTAGRRWVDDNPDSTRLTGLPKRSPSRPRRKPSQKRTMVPGVTLEMLENTRKVMPVDEFHQVWGELYDQLLAEQRAKSITQITQRELGRRARLRLDEIHQFLQGKSAGLPSSAVLCEWIHFSYALQLHPEAAALLSFVQKEELDLVVYDQARRVSEVSRQKLMA
jgi:hypothetical protein